MDKEVNDKARDTRGRPSEPRSDDPGSVRIPAADIEGTAFVVPIDAPIPNELADIKMPVGTLYQRLEGLATEHGTGFAFVPLTGLELLSLARAWHQLQVAKKVTALGGLPGAKYEAIWDQARREIGLSTTDWTTVAELLGEKARLAQRTGDVSPWLKPVQLNDKPPARRPRTNNIGDVDKTLPLPPAAEEESDAS